jgi:hypothetical protein
VIKKCKYIGVQVKCAFFVSDLSETWDVLDSFFCSKNTQIQNFMKIRPLVAELFDADRRTDGCDEACLLLTYLLSYLVTHSLH